MEELQTFIVVLENRAATWVASKSYLRKMVWSQRMFGLNKKRHQKVCWETSSILRSTAFIFYGCLHRLPQVNDLKQCPYCPQFPGVGGLGTAQLNEVCAWGTTWPESKHWRGCVPSCRLLGRTHSQTRSNCCQNSVPHR